MWFRVDWGNLQIHGYPLDTMWDPVFRVDWGNLQIHGYPLDIHGIGSRLGQCMPIGSSWHWHPWVDWDSVESWDSLRS